MSNPPTMLYHVGCGMALFSFESARKGTMAMACGTCSAGSPIVVDDLSNAAVLENPVCLPSSLARAMLQGGFKGDVVPHIEYYLGYSDFRCPAKAEWGRVLRQNLKMFSISECTDPKCIEAVRRHAERQRLVGRR